MILSIIIPVYNVEKYIRLCMESMYAQDLPLNQYEVIVINDGTEDNSMDIVRTYSNYSNLTIIEQENQGLSVTRNVGLQVAKGDFVWFVDSDDSIESNCLLNITTELVSLKSDVFAYQIKQIDEQTGDITIRSHKIGSMPPIRTGVEYFIAEGAYAPVQMFIMKRSFLLLNNLFFREGIFHEDLEFGPILLYNAASLSVINQPYYLYLQRTAGSITTTFNPRRAKDLLSVYKRLYTFHKESAKEKQLEKRFIKIEFELIIFSIKILKKCTNISFIRQFLKENKKTYRSASLKALSINDAKLSFFALLILTHPFIAFKYFQLRK